MSPQRKLSLFAVACLMPQLALAQAEASKAAVTIYGTLNVNLQTTKAGGATAAAQSVSSRMAVSTDSSNLGVRASLEASEWVTAVAQCETSAQVDGVGVSGICNRNSRIGLSTRWGTLFYGIWDTPFKAATYGTKADDPFFNTDVYGFQGIMGSPGFNYRSGGWSTASNTSTTGFDVRANNSVAYHSPRWMGLSGKLQYSANEFKNVNGSQDPQLFGAVLNWDQGPVSVLAALEYRTDGYGLAGINGAVGAAFGSTAANNANTSSSDLAWRLGAGYELASSVGATTLSALFEQLSYDQGHAATGAVKNFKRTAWQLALKHRHGNHEIRARFSQADAGSVTLANSAAGTTAGYGASMYALGYGYFFTSTLQAYLSYAQIMNDTNARYTLTIGGAPAVAGATPAGGDPMALGLGLRWAF